MSVRFVTLAQAIEKSCDTYFYQLGLKLSLAKLVAGGVSLRFRERSGIDLPNEVQGLVPSTEWKREKVHEKWYAGETISVSIGQGAVALGHDVVLVDGLQVLLA